MSDSRESPTPSWLHWWAVGTVCATFILLALGSIVTTFRVGMADPVWPTAPWHLFFISWEEPRPGFVIEHSHRLAGYIVGCLIILLTIGLWQRDSRQAVRWLGLAALLGVIVQGWLGGFRVVLHAILGTNLAIIHGSFAQVVFSLLVVLAIVTSAGWFRLPALRESKSLRRLSLAAVGLMFVQIVAGAILRHTFSPLGQRLHLLFAFVAVAATACLIKMIFDQYSRERCLRIPAWTLIGLLGLQIMLGAEAWLKRFSGPLPPEGQTVTAGQAAIITAHVLIGYCLLALTVAISLYAFRLTRREAGAAQPELEAAA